MQTINLQSVADATGLPVRRLRYVLDHRVLPGFEKASRGHRVTREFTRFEAFGIACAAALMHAGIRRPLVRRCMAELLSVAADADVRRTPLELLHRASRKTRVEMADGMHCRMVVEGREPSPWRRLGGRRSNPSAQPTVIFCLDTSAIQRALGIEIIPHD